MESSFQDPNSVGALPEEFWSARPALKHVREAAWSRGRSPEATLAAVMARVAADTPHTLELPPIVGAPCGISLLVAVVGHPGSGKSTTKSIASELTPACILDRGCDDVPPGSGEGLIELLFDMVDEEGTNGKVTKVKRQTRYNCFAYLDEGETLAKQANRASGNTILPTIRSIFTSGTLGQANASQERKRMVPAGLYVYGLVIGIQPEKAGPLFEDAGGGTPQRFLWASAGTPAPAPGERPPWPGALQWEPPSEQRLLARRTMFGGLLRHRLGIDPEIASEVEQNDHRKRLSGCDALDEHADLIRLKVAAILALLDYRLDIDVEDWHLAGMVCEASRQVRADVIDQLGQMARRREQESRGRRVRDAVAADEAVERRRIVDCARKIADKVAKEPKRWTVLELRRAMRHHRDVLEAAVDHAVAEGWVSEVAEAGQGTPKRALRPGTKRERQGVDGVDGTPPRFDPQKGPRTNMQENKSPVHYTSALAGARMEGVDGTPPATPSCARAACKAIGTMTDLETARPLCADHWTEMGYPTLARSST